MAHFILEYSANLNAEQIALDRLFEKLHQSAVDSKIFPLAGIRSRATKCDNFRVADGNPNYGFLHLQVKIGSGRTQVEKESSAQSFFDLLTEHVEALYNNQGLAISFEMTELPETLKFNKNNLREYLSS